MSRLTPVVQIAATAFGYGCALAGIFRLLVSADLQQPPTLLAWMIALGGMLLTGFILIRLGGRATRIAGESLALVVLPAWGILLNQALPDCSAACSGHYRLLSLPHGYGLYSFFAMSVVVYAISRARPEVLRPMTEIALLSLLGAGILMMLLVAVQFGGKPLFGLVLGPMGLPLVAPLLVIALFGGEFLRRARRRGEAANEGQEAVPRLLGVSLALSPVLLGLYALVHALLARDPGAALRTFTDTCSATLSQLHPPDGDCHYLCTVAARGHGTLVRPLRIGRRHGVPILVNRQLAVANAFEDLLHDRWPRFGRLARHLYDRLGWPVSRYIRSRWASDAVYVLMKPAEWLFFVLLLLLDRTSPERRIDRMYR